MRGRISWLVVAATTAVVLSFVIPLCLLVRLLAEDRAMAAADQEARNVAILVSTLDHSDRLGELVAATDARGPARTTLLLEDGTTLGAAFPGAATDPAVRQARTGDAVTTRSAAGGTIALPVVLADGTEVVVSRVSAADLHRGVVRAWASIIGLGVVLLAVALFVADRIGRRISQPIVATAGVADRLRDGDLDARAEVAGPPEAKHLARALNDLADRVTELLAGERAAVGDLSHRLRTPVTALRLDAEAVDDDELGGRLQEHIAVLQREIDAIVHDARRPVRENMATSCDARSVVAARVGFWSPLAEDQARRLAVRLGEEPLVVGLAAADLRDVVDVLVDNVFAHTTEGVGFGVRLERQGDQVVLEVTDEGTGDPGRREVGERRPGSTGLGLDIVRRTVAAAGGSTRVELTSQGGRVEVLLPTHGKGPA